MRAAEGPLYTNCAVYPPDSDEIIFYCDGGRMQFYLDRRLATLLQEKPPVIRLNFKPKGRGHAGDPFFIQARPNRCVVCGTDKLLSKHHVVPEAYRRFFPRDRLRNWAYDVLALCIDCHARYELPAGELKAVLAAEHGIDASGWNSIDRDTARFIQFSVALERHGGRIPAERRREMEDWLRRYLKKDGELTIEDRRLWRKLQREAYTVPAAEVVIARLTDIDGFAIRWRRHFIEHMQPRFLPAHWNPERRIYSELDPNKPSGH